MLIQINKNETLPDDFFIYCKTEDELIGFTKDENFSNYEISEIPTDANEFFIPGYESNEYLTYEEIKERLNKLKPNLIEELKNMINEIRDEQCYSPIEYKGNLFKADLVSQQDITDAVLLAMVTGPSFKKDWVTYNGIVTLNYEDIIGLKTAIGLRRQELVYKANILKSKLYELEYEELTQFEINL